MGTSQVVQERCRLGARLSAATAARRKKRNEVTVIFGGNAPDPTTPIQPHAWHRRRHTRFRHHPWCSAPPVAMTSSAAYMVLRVKL